MPIYPSYNPNIPQVEMQAVAQLVIAAQQSFSTLVIAFAAENIIMGITASGKTGLIADALQDVMYAGTSGSLWEAYSALEQVVITPEMAPFLTQDRLNWMKNQLQQAIAEL
jgi:hypothetical protein